MTAPNRINGRTRRERMKMCFNKRRFSCELGARAAGLISLEERPDSGYEKLWPYKCPICKCWHLTKKRKSGTEPIQLEKYQEQMAA